MSTSHNAIIDLRSGTCVEVGKAHGGVVQSIALILDGTGFLTGSVDQDVKFNWCKRLVNFCLDKHFTVSPTRSLKMNDDVQVVAASPDGNYVVVALSDNTVKVFYMDSLKFFLSLYGHKLPVFCMDIYSDGDLLVTSSVDKSVMGVKFVHNTHYFFTVGKDRLVKYWHPDKFELLLTLEGQHAEVWCLTNRNRGDFLVTGSHDRSIRRWDRTDDEAFFIEYGPKKEIPEEGAVTLAGKKTEETLTATDSIIEALDMAGDKSKGKVLEFRPNILMLGLSHSDYVLCPLSSVRTNDLEQTLLKVVCIKFEFCPESDRPSTQESGACLWGINITIATSSSSVDFNFLR
ncbi:hypothetical protein KY290_036189 [Solanum tuberosum]|uniref:WD-repeat protein n=1 Tax=Solanum tuberosum TaxID=4113 RepID=A0ABQ7TRY3_SOLTU|nr:hypothetical protein KY285_035467 [Solanum tuberosum]KAH0737484.1 hypothetical protein KY290_036189 [Solanum tuberosum]